MDNLEELEERLKEKKRLLLLKEKKLKSYKRNKKIKLHSETVLQSISVDDHIKPTNTDGVNKKKSAKMVTFKESPIMKNSNESTMRSKVTEFQKCISVGSSPFSDNRFENCGTPKNIKLAMKSENIPTIRNTILKQGMEYSKNEYFSPRNLAVQAKAACSTPNTFKFGKRPHYVDDDIFDDCDITGIFEDIEMMEIKSRDNSVAEALSVIKPNNECSRKSLVENTSETMNVSGIAKSTYSLYKLPEDINVLAVSAIVTEVGSIYMLVVCQTNISMWKLSPFSKNKYDKIAEQIVKNSIERAFLYPLNTGNEVHFFLISMSDRSTFLSVISYTEENKFKLVDKNCNDLVICSSCNLVGCVVDSWSVAVAAIKCGNLCCTNGKEMRTLCLMCIDLVFSKRKNNWQLNIEFLTRELPLQQISFMKRFSSDDTTDLLSLLLYHETGFQFGVIDLSEFVILNKFILDIPCNINNSCNIIWMNVIKESLFLIVQTTASVYIATADPSTSQIDIFHTWTLSEKDTEISKFLPVITEINEEFLALFSNGSYYTLPCPTVA